MIKITSFSIREVYKEDFNSVASLLEDLMEEPIEEAKSKQIWNNNFTSDHYKGFVAVQNGEIVGYIDIIYYQDVAHGGNLGIIQNLIVKTQHRGKGIGTALLRHAIDFAKENNFLELHVWAEFDNERAIALYEKLGFEKRCLLLEYEFD